MCEFISWIEKDGKNYFLTSADLASKRGIKLREHCGDDDDLVGHGALRWYYGGFEGGTKKECTDFSTPLNFPAEIVEAIKAGKFRGMGYPVGLLNEAARAEFDKVVDPAWAEFDKIVNAARAEFKKIRDAAWSEFGKIVNAARAEFNKIVEPARAEYDKIINKTFWDLFMITENRNPAWI